MNKYLLALALICLLALSAIIQANPTRVFADDDDSLDDQAAVDQINNHPQRTWTAGTNARFHGKKLRDVRGMLGALPEPSRRNLYETCNGVNCGVFSCCNGACYSPSQYTCSNGRLCPVGFMACGTGTAFSCYNPNIYNCVNGVLTPKGVTPSPTPAPTPTPTPAPTPVPSTVTCSGKYASDPTVCSGRGRCTASNTCTCNSGYTGNNCQYYVCYGYASNNAAACSGRGTCINVNNCACNSGFSGSMCEISSSPTPSPTPAPTPSPSGTIPASFNAANQWASCIHPIRDQGSCGSCWAFSSSSVFSDRLCIATNGATNVVLSPQYQTSCDTMEAGCSGGYLTYTWQFLANTGTTSDTCVPYANQYTTSKLACPVSCSNGQPMTKYRVRSDSIQMYLGSSRIADVQRDIMTYGPVQAAMDIYTDFYYYKSGVYTHTSGGFAGGHAIKLIGWGVDTATGLPYWIAHNSWGTSWGMNGLFWIKRGSNEAGIESLIMSARPL